jgi:hypothetical protein
LINILPLSHNNEIKFGDKINFGFKGHKKQRIYTNKKEVAVSLFTAPLLTTHSPFRIVSLPGCSPAEPVLFPILRQI